MKSIHLLATLSALPFLLHTLTSHADTSTTCYAQVLVPASYNPATEKVVTHEASPTITATPAVLGTGERKIKTADAYIEYEVIPAKFGEVTETVEVERERVEVETLPAIYRTETKQVKTKEATTRWNPACPAVAAEDPTAIPSHCLIETPAEYQTISREVVATPARTVKRIIPGKTETVTRKVLLEPAQVVRKEIPAEYTNIKLSRVEQAAKTTITPDQETSQDVAIMRKIRAESFRKMPVLCADQTDTIKQAQQRLQQLGYYHGVPTGTLDNATRLAVTHFQDENQLASGALTMETLQKLLLP